MDSTRFTGTLRIESKALLCAFMVLAGLIVLFSAPSGAVSSVGQGEDDWWITYPDQSPIAGSEVDHPLWVLDALKKKPVAILAHLECDYCAPQKEAMDNMVGPEGEFYGQIDFFDIMAGDDSRANDVVTIYNFNEDRGQVPMTVILTLVEDSEGEVQVGWHAAEETTGVDWVRSYMDDALSYYDQNSDDWNK